MKLAWLIFSTLCTLIGFLVVATLLVSMLAVLASLNWIGSVAVALAAGAVFAAGELFRQRFPKNRP